jgi:hypothetical protein
MVPLFMQDGFMICFEALPEDLDMHDHFVNECGWSEAEFEEIEDLDWFCAKVSAWRNGEELGAAYLGACCYEDSSEFYTKYKDDYFSDMVKDAIEEAKSTVSH